MQNTKVLGRFRPLIRILSAYNINNNDSFQILTTLIVSVFLFAMTSTIILVIWFCFDHNFILNEVSFALPIFVGGIQMLLIFVYLAKDNQMINKTIDRLQDIIELRK